MDFDKFNKIVKLVDGLFDECSSRQIKAFQFFNDNPEFNPANYRVERRSNGYNPEYNGRKGCKIGYTNHPGSGYSLYECYMVRSDST